ncbi:hypothetical protein LEQ_2472 [Ligilactobacillus equi DPC 6820]|uniref:Uncharacterized protein n=1 Tax=Ligilactobacillus equi DPC 6820 TaxID=1392007 RepID=V7HXM4_9LACO|nr:hypothetical protein LEQ_2472 [Ligilactobacillus equi DPC 6820]
MGVRIVEDLDFFVTLVTFRELELARADDVEDDVTSTFSSLIACTELLLPSIN